jgi:hypothetical protein
MIIKIVFLILKPSKIKNNILFIKNKVDSLNNVKNFSIFILNLKNILR